MLPLLEDGATHVGVATDHVIESFRNDLWPGYKTSAGIDRELLAQFPLIEEVLAAVGIAVFPMVEYEADDALGAAAALAAADDRVEQVLICTPDKDLGQCVGGKVVQLDRRKQVDARRDGVQEKFGVWPESIPDYLALVGDSADGFPGLAGWGASLPPACWPATATSRRSRRGRRLGRAGPGGGEAGGDAARPDGVPAVPAHRHRRGRRTAGDEVDELGGPGPPPTCGLASRSTRRARRAGRGAGRAGT